LNAHVISEKEERAQVEAWALVAVFVGVGALGTAVGFLLDSRLDTDPWLLLAGAVAGVGAGLFLMIRSSLAYARREERGT